MPTAVEDRITFNPEQCGGRSCVRGYRLRVTDVLDMVPTNRRAVGTFRHHVVALGRRTLRRRGQRDTTSWKRIEGIAADHLPKPSTPGHVNASPSNT